MGLHSLCDSETCLSMSLPEVPAFRQDSIGIVQPAEGVLRYAVLGVEVQVAVPVDKELNDSSLQSEKSTPDFKKRKLRCVNYLIGG